MVIIKITHQVIIYNQFHIMSVALYIIDRSELSVYSFDDMRILLNPSIL